MFRSVIISLGEFIRLENHWMIVEAQEHELMRIPIEDIYCVLIDNPLLKMTVPVINALTESGAHIIICDNHHVPVSVLYSLNRHYQPLNVIRRQLEMSQQSKDRTWKYIVAHKIGNQARCLRIRHTYSTSARRLEKLALEVEDGDVSNREGIAAKLFFRALYGSEFLRSNDDGINAALNYGYALMRSAIAKTLTAYGYNCVVGIHHINEKNPFNLADDLMEPLRPLVDLWVDINLEELSEVYLTKATRTKLVNLLNHTLKCAGKKMKVHNAIDKYINSYTSALKRNDLSLIKFPILLPESGEYQDW